MNVTAVTPARMIHGIESQDRWRRCQPSVPAGRPLLCCQPRQELIGGIVVAAWSILQQKHVRLIYTIL
jgi:hypothetical protein